MKGAGETEERKSAVMAKIKHNLIIITSKNKVIRNRPGRLIRSQVIAAAKELIQKYDPLDPNPKFYF